MEGYRPPPGKLDPDRLRPGQIKYLNPAGDLGLPRDEDTKQAVMDQWLNDLRPPMLDHPVIIESVQPRNTSVVILLVTAFRDSYTLRLKFDENPKLRDRHLPLHPADPHPSNGILLKAKYTGPAIPLKQWNQENKPSWVSINRFQCPVWALREEIKGPWQLEEETLQELKDRIRMKWDKTISYTDEQRQEPAEWFIDE